MRRIFTLALLLAIAPSCTHVSKAERDAVDRYTTTVAPLAREGGRIVVQEIRPSLGDIESGKITGAEFRQRAAAWKSAMQRVRDGFAAASTGARLEPIRTAFDDAFVLYLSAIDKFAAASVKTGQALNDAITAAVPTAEQADKTYDRAVELLKKERRRVGLPQVSVP